MQLVVAVSPNDKIVTRGSDAVPMDNTDPCTILCYYRGTLGAQMKIALEIILKEIRHHHF